MARRSQVEWESLVAHALRYAGDPFALEGSPLAEDPVVRQVARTTYPDHGSKYGLAVQDCIRTAAGKVEALYTAPQYAAFREFLHYYGKGFPITQIAVMVGISREHIQKEWKPKAVKLITAQLQADLKDEKLVAA